MRPSKKWNRIAKLYKRFAIDFSFADFSDEAALNMFIFESQGVSIPNVENNGFALGKKWMDVTIAAWKEDINKGLLFPFELLDDGYPEWFLKKVGILSKYSGS